MGITNAQSGTRIDEIAGRIYRISTPVAAIPGGFTFNQYLIVDEAPLLFHTGLRHMLDLTREAVASVMPVSVCATSPSPMSRRTNVARSINGWPLRLRLCRFVAQLPP